MSRLRARWLGRMAYQEAWDLQKALHEGRAQGRSADDYLLLLEHPPTYTVGRSGDDSNLLVGTKVLEAIGAEVHHVDRGGDITFHGPGQLVGYPIVHLGDRPDVVAHVRHMEHALIRALADLGVEAWREDGYTGVWTAQGKVAAIGVRLARRVTTHGFALNLSTDLAYFRHIVPCGIPDRPVTSVSRLLGRHVSFSEAMGPVLRRFAELGGYSEVEAQLGASGGEAGLRAEVAPAPAGTLGPATGRERDRPEWMKVRLQAGAPYRDLKRLTRGLELHTVCEEAGCPNIYECWASGTATFMILGNICTRNCAFCGVESGRPQDPDPAEPLRVAEAVARLGLNHAVVTSVTRDDLPDGGAAAFAATIAAIREWAPGCGVEVLIPDLKGKAKSLEAVISQRPEVLNHNVETVLRLQRRVRPAAGYGRSLALLGRARAGEFPGLVKSGLILGLGETGDEVRGALADLRAVGVEVVTLGQYLRPSAAHWPIHCYVSPEEFAAYRAEGEALGFTAVESGPLVRSSYHAAEVARANQAGLGGVYPGSGRQTGKG